MSKTVKEFLLRPKLRNKLWYNIRGDKIMPKIQKPKDFFYNISYDDLAKKVISTSQDCKKTIKPELRSASLRLTENCNSKCITCNHWRRKYDQDEHLTKIEWENIILQLIEQGVTTLYFTGGEPLLYNDLFKLISFAKQKGIHRIKLLTNGLLINKFISFIEKSGIDELHISLDGIGKINDKIRGIDGHFNKVVKVMEKMKNINQKKFINMTLLSENIEQYQELKKLSSKYNFYIGINLPSTKAYYLKNVNLNYPTKFQMKNFLSLIDLEEDYKNYIYKYMTNQGYDTNKTCILGLKIIYIGFKGDVYSACHEFPPIGNLREDRLTNIIFSKRYSDRLKRMIMHKCPGCACGFSENLNISNRI